MHSAQDQKHLLSEPARGRGLHGNIIKGEKLSPSWDLTPTFKAALCPDQCSQDRVESRSQSQESFQTFPCKPNFSHLTLPEVGNSLLGLQSPGLLMQSSIWSHIHTTAQHSARHPLSCPSAVACPNPGLVCIREDLVRPDPKGCTAHTHGSLSVGTAQWVLSQRAISAEGCCCICASN